LKGEGGGGEKTLLGNGAAALVVVEKGKNNNMLEKPEQSPPQTNGWRGKTREARGEKNRTEWTLCSEKKKGVNSEKESSWN